MAIKITCDICGEEITERTDATLFDDYQFCNRCYKAIEPQRNAWKSWKRYCFVNFYMDEINKIKSPKKGKPAPHTHVCKSKGGKPAAVATVKGTPKSHVHKLVTTPELAKAIGAKVHTVQCFALRKGLGTIDQKKRVRVFNEADVKVITSHFRATK